MTEVKTMNKSNKLNASLLNSYHPRAIILREDSPVKMIKNRMLKICITKRIVSLCFGCPSNAIVIVFKTMIVIMNPSKYLDEMISKHLLTIGF